MLDSRRFLSFFFLLGGFIFMVGCVAAEPMPTATAVISITETPTQTPQPSATLTIRATETAVATTTPSLTPINVSTETPLPTSSLPSASILFVRDDDLQQWMPQTNEIKVLAENIYSWVTYADDIVMFMREAIPEKEYDLVAFHVPTKSEFMTKRLYSRQLYTPDKIIYSSPSQLSISISPDSEWLAFATYEEEQNELSLAVHKLIVDDQGVRIGSPVFQPNLIEIFENRDIDISWPQKNHISWRDSNGIWIANLVDDVAPAIAIQPSTNTFPGPFCPEDVDPCLWGSTYIPVSWSNDGRYVLILDYGHEEGGIWYIIEAETNRIFEFIDSYSGVGGDSFEWIDSKTIMQFNTDQKLRIWRINSDQDTFVSLEKEYQLPPELGHDFYGIMMPDDYVRFGSSNLSGPAATAFYDLDLSTGELLKISPDVAQRKPVIDWSPDRQHVLSRETFFGGSMYLFDLNGSQPLDVQSILGADSCCWHWYETE